MAFSDRKNCSTSLLTAAVQNSKNADIALDNSAQPASREEKRYHLQLTKLALIILALHVVAVHAITLTLYTVHLQALPHSE
jgi:hypothetical protein